MVTTELNPTVEKKSIRCLEENRLLLKNVKKCKGILKLEENSIEGKKQTREQMQNGKR